MCPGDLVHVWLTSTASASVGLAMRLAAGHAAMREGPSTARRVFFTLDEAYHGDTTRGAVSLGFSSLFHPPYAHLPYAQVASELRKLPGTDVARRPMGETTACFARRVTDEAVRRIRDAGPSLCAVIIEPLMHGAAGMIAQHAGFVAAVAEATRSVGGLLICDEVATGFWRTGSRFACEQEGVTPDILCLAKGLGAARSALAATVARAHVHERAPTANGSQMTDASCAEALASLDLIEVLASSGRIAALEVRLAKRLARLASESKHVLEVRRRGMMVGVELVADRLSGTPFPRMARVGQHVAQRAQRRGVDVRALGNVIVLMPPFSFTDAELDRTIDALRAAMGDVCTPLARALH